MAKCTRVIEYEAETREEIEEHLERTLLSRATVQGLPPEIVEHGPGGCLMELKPGERSDGGVMIHGGARAPKVTIRLMSEAWS